MTTLVVQMHPVPESFNAAVLEATLAGLGRAGIEPDVRRLGQGDALEADDLDGVETLVVVAPTWWGGPPAQLLERLQALLGAAPSPLRSVRRLMVVTTHGSSQLVNTLQGEPGRRLWKRVVLPLCAPGATFDWVALYKIDRLDEDGRVTFLDRVTSAAAQL